MPQSEWMNAIAELVWSGCSFCACLHPQKATPMLQWETSDSRVGPDVDSAHGGVREYPQEVVGAQRRRREGFGGLERERGPQKGNLILAKPKT